MSSETVTKVMPRIRTTNAWLQCAICANLLNGPLQFPCGHRICTPCARILKQKSALTFFCQKCNENVDFADCFHDKAMAKEIDNVVVSCPFCSWTREYCHLQEHLKDECQMIEMSCPNVGCSKVVMRSEIVKHFQECQYAKTSQCSNHIATSSPLNSQDSLVSTAPQQCIFAFIGCQFCGSNVEVSMHMENDTKNHLNFVCKYLSSQLHTSHKQNSIVPTDNKELQLLLSNFEKLKMSLEKITSEANEIKSQIAELQRSRKDMTIQLNGIEELLATTQRSISENNCSLEEASLTLQTLQATSYDGKYIWKIPDITRRRRDALLGKTVSLYSAPFYTDRFGYRLCLRVYLDGDGSGKGHYISYFLTIMKGEFDALLEWPFQFTVTMTMINQKGNGNIVQSFKPNPASVSFHRPKADMNVASGCPKFAPISILDNPEFIVDDTAFFQCVINTKGSNKT